jgi:hypothetical protein
MVVTTPREKWTDEHLDGAFERLDSDIRELRGDMKDVRGEMNARFDKVDARFDRLSQILIGGAIAIVVALLGAIATLIGVSAL